MKITLRNIIIFIWTALFLIVCLTVQKNSIEIRKLQWKGMSAQERCESKGGDYTDAYLIGKNGGEIIFLSPPTPEEIAKYRTEPAHCYNIKTQTYTLKNGVWITSEERELKP